ncbi:MAG: ABC transporter permease [Pontibacterium sp.]
MHKKVISRTIKGVLSVLLALAIWQLVIWLTGVPKFILPSPAQVYSAWTSNVGLIAEHATVTMIEVVIGLLLGSLLGAITAISLAYSNRAQQLVSPLLVVSQTIPVFALAPLLTLWLGYGLSSKIAMTLLIIYFPVTSTFYDGLRNTPQGLLDLAATMNASKQRVLWHIRIPAALPSLASGMRLAAVYAPIGAIIGEWVGASKGLGYLMLLANGRVKTDLMFAALITLCVLTVLLRALIGVLCQRVSHWAAPKA